MFRCNSESLFFTEVGSSLTCKYQTRVEVTGNYKPSSLLQYGYDNGRKKGYNSEPSVNIKKKLFSSSLTLRQNKLERFTLGSSFSGQPDIWKQGPEPTPTGMEQLSVTHSISRFQAFQKNEWDKHSSLFRGSCSDEEKGLITQTFKTCTLNIVTLLASQ